jgi:parallel beta-helix repeat protein
MKRTPISSLKLAVGATSLCAQLVSASVRYVDLNSTNATPPFTNWQTAAVTIQAAVDAAEPGDQISVTNGVYATGGRVVSPYLLTNRVVVNKAVLVQSVNGPGVTVIQGYRVPTLLYGNIAVRCVYLANGASLVGFTLTNGATRNSGNQTNDQSGGGLWCASTGAVVSNCVLVGNSAYYAGGGIYSGTLHNCVVTTNTAQYGGGGNGATLNN